MLLRWGEDPGLSGGAHVITSILREGGKTVRVREADVMVEAEVGVMWGQEPRARTGSRSWKGQGNGFSPRRNTALLNP